MRNFHLANALGATCRVTILQIINPGEVPAPQGPSTFQQVLSAAREKSYTPLKILRGLAGPMPVTVLNYTSSNVAEVLADALRAESYDAVQMESIHLFRYLQTSREAKKSPAAVLDWHNIESELMQRYAEGAANPAKKLVASRTAQLLYKLEHQALASFAAHTVVSEREKEKLLKRAPHAQIHVIPNGVDSAAFAAGSKTESALSARKTLLFVGSMDYHANADAVLWFCAEIWPRLAAEFPELDFKIVGRNPSPKIQGLASSRISVTGTVDDVKRFYHQAFAVIVPLRVGGGTRLKILEAMAASVPVISTSLGAEGIAAQDGRDILIADTAAAMANSISALLHQPELAGRLQARGRELVTKEYDWTVLGKQLAGVYAGLRL